MKEGRLSHFSHLFLLHTLPGALEGTCWACRGSTCPWFPLCQHTHVASLSPSTLPLPVLIFPFRLHGDSPLWLACIPASARDSEPSSVPPSFRALVPAVLSPPPGVSPEAASSSRHLFSSSDGVSSSGETNPPTPSTCHSSPALPYLPLVEGLVGLYSQLPDPLPTPSLPCRGLLFQSFPFVTGLANRRVLRSEEADGGGKGLPGDGGWVCGVGMRGH